MIKTKQELLNHFSDINFMYNNPFMYQTLSNMIDELLEQQPCEDILDKIRAEIEQITDEEQKHDEKWAIGLRYAIKIIDKYREGDAE